MTNSIHKAIFGDKEHDFKLTIEGAKAVEDETKTPLRKLMLICYQGELTLENMPPIIRNGLIGGGMGKIHAAEFVNKYIPVYFDESGHTKLYDLCVSILVAAASGRGDDPVGKPEGVEMTETIL